MCNLAGYVGNRRAAPILLEMLKEQEGFGGGYYTGIATICDGKLYHAKVVGDTSKLLLETDAERFPGTVGIIHSRSKSGGDVEWGHPFVGSDETMAYVANGHTDFYSGCINKNELAQDLLEKGYVYRAKSNQSMGKYPVLSDGTCVHSSEVMCYLIDSLIKGGVGPAEAMKNSFIKFPGELVGLLLHVSEPNTIFTTRISQPLMIGYSKDAIYLSTTALAFPADVHTASPMPVNSTAAVRSDSIEILSFNSPPENVCTNIPWYEGYKKIIELLSDSNNEYCGLGCLKQGTAPIWPKDMAPQKDMLVYEVIRYLYGKKEIDFKHIEKEGVLPGITMKQKVAYQVK